MVDPPEFLDAGKGGAFIRGKSELQGKKLLHR